MGKTKVMSSQVGADQTEESGKWPCGMCKRGIGRNLIQCCTCNKWIHVRSNKLKGKLKDLTNYQCPNCAIVARIGGTVEAVESAVDIDSLPNDRYR